MASGTWRFDTYVYRDQGGGSTAQIPAAATINFYRQGATVSQAVTVPVTINDPDPQPTVVSVYDSATLLLADILHYNGDPNVRLSVAEVTSKSSVKLLNLSLAPIMLAVADRLIDSTSPRPIAYKDPLGTVSLGSAISTDAATGRAGCYLVESVLDYVVTGSGITPRAFVDVEGGTSVGWINAKRFSSIQAAIDALPSTGGVVYIPAGTYNVAATITIPRNKPVHLLGDGAERTILSCTSTSVDILKIKSSYSTVENLTIKGPNAGGSGRGIVVGQILEGGVQPEVMKRVSILGCRVIDTASWCLQFLGDGDPGAIAAKTLTIFVHVERCGFQNNIFSGCLRIGIDCNSHLYSHCSFDFFRGVAVEAIATSSLMFLTCTFEDRRDVAAPPAVLPYVAFDGCNNVGLLSCWFETHEPSPNDQFQHLVSVGPTIPCQDVRISGCRFVRAVGTLPRLVKVASNSKGVLIENPTCTIANPLGPDDTRFTGIEANKDIFTVDGCEVVLTGGIVNAFGAVPALALSNATGSSLVGAGPRVSVPRRTTANRDSTMSTARDAKPGDLIFNDTNKGLQFRGSSTWIPFGRIGTADFNGSISMPAFLALVQSGAAGVYRVAVYLEKISAGLGGVQVDVRWMDEAVQRTISVTVTGTGANGFASDEFVVYLAAGQSIEYQVSTSSQLHQTRARLRAEAI